MAGPKAAMGAFLLLPFARRLRGKAALRGGCFVCRAEGVFLPARRQRALRFAEPRLSWAGVCPPAASGHLALQNRACLGRVFARPPPAGALPCETALVLGWRLPACRQRALCLAEPCLSWAGVCPPAASGHFTLRNCACFGRVFARLPPDEIGAAAACGASHAGHAASPGPG